MWPDHASRWPSSSRGEDDGDDGGGDDGDGDDGDGDGHDVDGGQPLSPEETANVILVETPNLQRKSFFPQLP